jgi:acyl-ACP thioesterase
MIEIERKNIWDEQFQIRFNEIDRSYRLTLKAVFNFLQETAINHAENLGVGRAAMAKNNQVWIISRISVQIFKRPQYRETVTVRTWPRGGEKLFAFRNYEIRSSQDIPLVQARSCWLIVDLEKRRPLRPQIVINMLPLNEGIDISPINIGSLSEVPNLQKATERKAAYSDLDYNGHVNNVSYIQWIQDTLEPVHLENAETMRLDINYLNEILPDEIVELWTAPLTDAGGNNFSEHSTAFEGRKPGGLPAFRAELRLNCLRAM